MLESSFLFALFKIPFPHAREMFLTKKVSLYHLLGLRMA